MVHVVSSTYDSYSTEFLSQLFAWTIVFVQLDTAQVLSEFIAYFTRLFIGMLIDRKYGMNCDFSHPRRFISIGVVVLHRVVHGFESNGRFSDFTASSQFCEGMIVVTELKGFVDGPTIVL